MQHSGLGHHPAGESEPTNGKRVAALCACQPTPTLTPIVLMQNTTGNTCYRISASVSDFASRPRPRTWVSQIFPVTVSCPAREHSSLRHGFPPCDDAAIFHTCLGGDTLTREVVKSAPGKRGLRIWHGPGPSFTAADPAWAICTAQTPVPMVRRRHPFASNPSPYTISRPRFTFHPPRSSARIAMWALRKPASRPSS